MSLGDHLNFKFPHPDASTSNFVRCWSVIGLRVLKVCVIQREFFWILTHCSIILFRPFKGACCPQSSGWPCLVYLHLRAPCGMPMEDKREGGDMVPNHSLPWLQKGLDGLRNVSVALRPGKAQYSLYWGMDGLVVGLDVHEVSPSRLFDLRTVQPVATTPSLPLSFVYLK